jgi:hypothetical protein
MNVTVPVGVVVADVTVAVNFTDCATTDGFNDDTTVVLVRAWSTVCISAADVLLAVCASPLYAAVMESAPAGMFVLVSVATPLALSVAVPRETVAFLNVTVPVGTLGAVEVTVAVSVTDCPYTEGFRLELGRPTELG